MDQLDIEAQNRDLLEKFLSRVRPGELISGIVTTRPSEPRKVIWYPVDQDRSNELLDGLAAIERLP
jgi:hypothetical protein